MKITLLFLFQLLCLNALFAQFSPEKVVSRDLSNVRIVKHADVNSDGQLDVVVSGTGGIIWYENEGNANFEKEHVVHYVGNYSLFFEVADLDADGHVDVLILDYITDRLECFFNDGTGVFTERLLIDDNFESGLSVEAADLDGDGDLDIVMGDSVNDETRLFFNDGNTNFSNAIILSNPDNALLYFTLDDLDGDDDIDIIGVGPIHIGWYENDGAGNFSYQAIGIGNGNGSFRALTVADCNADTHKDIVVTTNSRIWVFTNDGTQNFTGIEHGGGILGLNSLRSVAVEDMNGDGHLDLFYTSYYLDNVGWLQSDGMGGYPTRLYVNSDTPEPSGLVLADFNDNGMKDIVFVGYRQIVFGERSANQTFINQTNMLLDNPTYASGVGIMDVDGDGDMDVIGAYRDNTNSMEKELVWHENVDDNFPVQHLISDNSEGIDHLELADINNDGWTDIIVATNNNIEAYFHNGNAGFGASTLLISEIYKDFTIADIDNDDDLDIIYNTNSGGSLYSAKNDGNGNFSDESFAASNSLIIAINTADIDEDGDLDIIYADYTSDYARWRANDGNGNFTGSSVLIGTGLDGASSIEAGDLDGDNHLDIVVAAASGDLITWFKGNGIGNFTPQNSISTRDFPRSAPLGDIDNDGDLDILGVFYSDYMTWYSNDGNGNFQEEMLISIEDGQIETAILADVNSNSGLDVLAGFNFFQDQKIVWYESSYFQPGINATVTDVTCFDNDTPFDFMDDVVEFSLIVNQVGLSNSFHIATTDFQATGIYGENQTFTLAAGSAGLDDIVLTITDSNDPNFSIDINVENPGFCSASPSISAEVIAANCDANATPFDTTDDIIEFSVIVNQLGLSNTFTITSTDFSATGIYGQEETYALTAGSAGAGNVNLIITDSTDPNYWMTLPLADPGNCSTIPSISATVTNIDCNDNNTSMDISDDIIEFSLNVSQMGLGENFTISSDAGTVTPTIGNYDELINGTLEAGSAGSGDVLLTITDNENTGFQTTVTIIDPGSCSLDTSTDDLQHAAIKVFPNPSSADFHFEMSANKKDANLVIYNMLGQEIMEKKFIDDQCTFHTANLTEGAYFYRILNPDKELIQEGTLLLVK